MRIALNADNKKIYLRRALFAAVITAAAMLQNTAGLLPEPFGVRAMPLIPAVVCVGVFEREIPGTLLGVFAGLLWDMNAPSAGSFNAMMLAAVGFACGSLITHLMRNNLVTALILCSFFTVVQLTACWLRSFVFAGDLRGALSLFTFYLPSGLYTLVWLPAFYFLARSLMKRFG